MILEVSNTMGDCNSNGRATVKRLVADSTRFKHRKV